MHRSEAQTREEIVQHCEERIDKVQVEVHEEFRGTQYKYEMGSPLITSFTINSKGFLRSPSQTLLSSVSRLSPSVKMFTNMQTALPLAFSILSSLASAIDTTKNPDLVAKLDDAATALDRQKLLAADSDWTFDFFAQKHYTYSPGSMY